MHTLPRVFSMLPPTLRPPSPPGACLADPLCPFAAPLRPPSGSSSGGRFEGVVPHAGTSVVRVRPRAARTRPNDSRCVDIPENIPEDVFSLKVFTSADMKVGPGSLIGSWYKDETAPNRNPAPTFVLTGPGTNVNLSPSLDSHNLTRVFNSKHKERPHQVNITTTIPANARRGAAAAQGDHQVTRPA